MKFLVAEDDDDKRQRIIEVLQASFPNWDILEARSFQSGLRAVEEDCPDIAILDMTMRNFDKSVSEDGGRPHHFAGREILRQMKREGNSTPALIVTQFDEFGEEGNKVTIRQLNQELAERFDNYRGTVQYRHNIESWKEHLRTIVSSIIAGRTA